jgi:hypothetical protein
MDTLHLTGQTYAAHLTSTIIEGHRKMLADNLVELVRLMPRKPKQSPGTQQDRQRPHRPLVANRRARNRAA